MKILLIEDNQSICKGLEYAFKSNGYECEIANSISSSKYIISNYNPQLIVLDVSLPDGNGFDLYIDTIKKLNIPTIFLTARDNEDDVVINAIASHHGDTEPTNIISVIVAIADTISASRPGARNDSSENYFQRLEQLEKIGNEIKGVEKTYAVQAGRELRVMVKPDEVDDLTSYSIAREIKERIENEMQYPGTIKVTVIRETRATEEAK